MYSYVQQIPQDGRDVEDVDTSACELGMAGTKSGTKSGPESKGPELEYKLNLGMDPGMDLSIETVKDVVVDEVSEFEDSDYFVDFDKSV